MAALVERITSPGQPATRDEVRRVTAKPKAGRPKAFTFNYRPQHKHFALRLSFRKGKAERQEVIEALESILEDLRRAKD